MPLRMDKELVRAGFIRYIHTLRPSRQKDIACEAWGGDLGPRLLRNSGILRISDGVYASGRCCIALVTSEPATSSLLQTSKPEMQLLQAKIVRLVRPKNT